MGMRSPRFGLGESGCTAPAAGLGLQGNCPGVADVGTPSPAAAEATELPWASRWPASAQPALRSSRWPSSWRQPNPCSAAPGVRHSSVLALPAAKAPPTLLAAGPTPIALSAREQPPRAGNGAGMVLTLKTSLQLQLWLPAGQGHVHPPQLAGQNAGDARAQPDWLAVAEGPWRGPLCHPLATCPLPHRRYLCLPKGMSPKHGGSYFPPVGQQTALLPGLTGKEPSGATANYFPLSAAKIPYLFGRQPGSTLSPARR